LVASGLIVDFLSFTGHKQLRAYKEVAEWTYDNGKVVGSKDLSSYILSFREELEAKEGSNKTNPYITIDKNEYPSLATCQGEWWINFL